MVIQIECLPDEPIILVTVEGYYSFDDALFVFSETERLRQGISGRVYRITDVRAAYSTLSDILKMIQVTARRSYGTSADPNVLVILVGDHQWSRLFIEALETEQIAGVETPLFNTLEEAFAYARACIQGSSGTT